MARSTKDGWLSGEGDLKESEVADVPVKGQSVKIRALSATTANAATSEAVSSSEGRGGQQQMKVDSVKLDILRFAHGVIEPEFTTAEATIISGKYGPAFNRVVQEIVKLSGLDQSTIAETEARFQDLGGNPGGSNGPDPASGDDGPAVPSRSGARAGNDG